MTSSAPVPLPPQRPKALTIPPVRQQLNLAVAVGGTAGGLILLSSNLLYVALAPVAGNPWIPLSANLALVFGGIMFAREYRRGRHE